MAHHEDKGTASINLAKVVQLSKYLTAIFEPLAKSDFPILEDYLAIIQEYIKEHGYKPEPIQIKTPYLTYDFDRRHVVAYNFSIYTNKPPMGHTKSKSKTEDIVQAKKEDKNRF